MLSWIQRNALMVLVRKEQALIQEMKPQDIESNLFSYHLQGLIGDGYVTKINRGTYSLTPKGHKLVGAFSTATNTQQENIKTVVILYAKNRDGKYLLFRWSRQPYIDHVTLLHDRMPLGKSLDDGIKSASVDKLGVELPSKYITSTLIKIMHKGELVSHMHALVYDIDIENMAFPYHSRNGTAFLASLIDVEEKMEGLDKLIESIESQSEPKELYLSY